MPKMDAIANVIVLAAAGIGTILVAVCAAKLLRNRGSRTDGAGLSQGQGG